MMSLDQIQKWFSDDLHTKSLGMLREYLQYEVLKIIFESKHGNAYTFLGGTCLRIVYGTERFSEDLDFDNVGLEAEQFEETGEAIKRELELLGYTVKIRFIYKGAFHCNITFPGLLFDYGMSGHKEAKLLIKLDTEKQHYEYERSLVRLQKFGVSADIFATPKALLASQKIAAIMGRKRPKGRDFYDLAWLLKRTTPDYGYLKQRFEVTTPEGLRQLINERIAPFDFDQLTRDVAPFLFNQESLKMVNEFPEFWQEVSLS